jgi:hypothetical protein
MIFTATGVSIRPTTHFEEQAKTRRLNRSAVLGCVVALAPRVMRYQGCRLALDCGQVGMPVVKIEPGHIEVLTVLAPGQNVVRSDTLRLRVDWRGATYQ